MTTPRNQTHLAELLGIAKSAVSAQAKRGMPTDSQAAQLWRTQHLDPARKKGARLDAHYQPSRPAQRPHPAPASDAVAQASGLLKVAESALAAGQCIDALVPALRAALRAVPVPERASVDLVSLPVMRVLLAHVLDVLPDRATNPTNDDGTPFYLGGDAMTNEDASFIGAVWYEIAAGELVFNLDVLESFYGTAAP